MKVLVQWTRQDPEGWVEIDSSEWARLPSLPELARGRVKGDVGIANAPGHVFNLNIQGLEFGGADHYCVEDLSDSSGGVRVTIWYDDPEDFPEGMKWARVCTLLPLAPDPRIGGAINTRQSFVIYAQPQKMAQLNRNVEQTTFRPWSEFHPPSDALTRHGIWTSDDLLRRHEAAALPHGWREWGQHLDPTELDPSGFVKSQRRLGRWRRAPGTITYFLHDTDLANGIHAAAQIGNENEMEETDVAFPTNQRYNGTAGQTDIAYVWTTLSGSPNVADWPNGAYRCQMDVSGVMNIANGYGLLTLNGVAGHFARVNSGLTSDLETWAQDEAAFTGTGIKLATHTINPAAGAAGDRFECVCVADGSGDSMNGRIDLSHDDSDSFADGPWVAGPSDTPITPGVGSIAAAGAIASVVIGTILTSVVGALAATGFAGSLILGTVQTPSVGTLAGSGETPSLIQGTVQTPPVGALSLSGNTPSLRQDIRLTPSAGALALTGQAPSVVRSTVITAVAGSITFTSNTANLVEGTVRGPPVGSLSLSGAAPSLRVDTRLTPSIGALVLTGFAPITDTRLTPAVGSLALTGFAPTLEISGDTTLTLATGSLALTGTAPSLVTGTRLTIPDGSLGLAGLPSSPVQGTILTPPTGQAFFGLEQDITQTPPAGSLAVSGLVPTLAEDIRISPSGGSLTLAGLVPSPVLGTPLTPPVGSLDLAGSPPSLEQDTRLIPATGSLVATGVAPSLRTDFRLTPAAGSLAATGNAPSLRQDARITPSVGSLGLSGTAPNAIRSTVQTPATGSLAIAGTTSSLREDTRLAPTDAALGLTGSAPLFDFGAIPSNGALALTGSAPTVEVTGPKTLTPSAASLTLTGKPPAFPLVGVITFANESARSPALVSESAQSPALVSESARSPALVSESP